MGRWANRYRKSRLNRESVGKAGSWYQGRKVRTLDQQQVVETCLFTVYPGVLVDIDWKITTKIWFIPVRNIDRKTDQIIITGEADGRHDRTGD